MEHDDTTHTRPGDGPEERQVETPWASAPEAVVEELDVDPDEGLSGEEVERRRERVGSNRLQAHATRSAWSILLHQFQSIIVLLLVVAAGVAFLFGEHVEGIAIVAVVLVNTAIGFLTELRAVRSMEALREIAEVDVRVRRDGEIREIPSRDLVPGDVVVVEAGNLVGADMRLLDQKDLEADESVLTGESAPVGKTLGHLDAETVLADRTNMLFRGTAVTRGRGTAVVVATGMATEVGRISELVEEAGQRETPIERKLDELGHKLVWICLALATLVAGIGRVQGKELFTVVETSIALAVATIPEGLPIVATLALARGMWRMADRNALIRNLAVVETLGSATTILTDKTGTLTENRMTVAAYRGPAADFEAETNDDGDDFDFVDGDEGPVAPDDDPVLRAALEIGLLCNDETSAVRGVADDEDSKRVGEPMELGLRQVARGAEIDAEAFLESQPRIAEEPFDADTAMMATYHRTDEGVRVAVKGAPEAVLNASSSMRTEAGTAPIDDETRRRWLEANQEMAESGLRILALAEKYVDDSDAPPYENLTFVALVGMIDPARSDVQAAIEACRSAGIEVVMATGDHPGTALYIARELEMAEPERLEAMHGGELDGAGTDAIVETPVFARVSPEQKLDLVQLHQRGGHVVAMTGDGVNDAPALMQADIGIAMGKRGTQVAREAADMVLGDDRFESIVAAIEQGRVIFDNIRKFAVYLLSCNVSELMVVSIAALAFPTAPLPLTALQILYLNLVTDVFPALALGFGEGDERVMERPPRDPSEDILDRPQWTRIAGFGAVLTAVVLGTFYVARFQWALPDEHAVTVSFLTLAFAQLWHVFNMRTTGTSRWNNDVTRNPFVWGALGLCTGLLLMAVYVPPVAAALDVVVPGWTGWGLALAASFVPVVVGLLRR
jgi:Ca2+-transporting ATPase